MYVNYMYVNCMYEVFLWMEEWCDVFEAKFVMEKGNKK